jgi:hypothetical protein
MSFYQKQMVLLSFLLILFIFLGLLIISANMEKITLRDEQDFIFIAAKEKDLWEVRILGISLEINKAVIRGQLQSTGFQIEQYVAKGSNSLKKLRVYLQEQLLWKRE